MKYKSRRNIKMNSAKHIKKIVETAEYYNHQEAKKADKKINDKNGYDYYHVSVGLKNEDTYSIYKGTLVVRITSNGKRFAYDIIKMSADYETQIEKRSGKKSPSADKPTIAQSDQTVNNNIRKKSKNDTEGSSNGSNPYIYSLRTRNVEYGMKEAERYNILKDAKIKVADGNVRFTENEINNLNKVIPYKFGTFFKILAGKFGLYTSYKIGDIKFNYSKQSVNESINKSDQNYAKSKEIAAMMYCTKDIIENAVPVMIHDDIYKGTIREDRKLKKVYVMLGAYENNNGIYPVEIIAKERT